MPWPAKTFSSKEAEFYFLLALVNNIPKVVWPDPALTITCVSNKIMSFD